MPALHLDLAADLLLDATAAQLVFAKDFEGADEAVRAFPGEIYANELPLAEWLADLEHAEMKGLDGRQWREDHGGLLHCIFLARQLRSRWAGPFVPVISEGAHAPPVPERRRIIASGVGGWFRSNLVELYHSDVISRQSWPLPTVSMLEHEVLDKRVEYLWFFLPSDDRESLKAGFKSCSSGHDAARTQHSQSGQDGRSD